MMKIILLLLTLIVQSNQELQQITRQDCEDEMQWRRPELTDIHVICGTSEIVLDVFVCPVLYTGLNETRLILNGQWGSECRATLEIFFSPYVARFRFPINNTRACGSIFKTTSGAGTGVFSDFSNVQWVNVSGVIKSSDPTQGMVTYNAELKYYYSCAYPLEYLINNTQLDVSSSSVAIRDINGTFVSTLDLVLFADIDYQTPLIIPEIGVDLNTIIYVQLKATNLTEQYNVILDRCFASISPYPSNSSSFNLLVPCKPDERTVILRNGEAQEANFYFPAFRFISQKEEMVSTYFIHCITRLCEVSTCSSFLMCDEMDENIDERRKKRDAVEASVEDDKTYTITSPPIITQNDNFHSKEQAVGAAARQSSTVGLSVAVGLLAVGCVAALGTAVVFYKRLRH